MLEFAGGGGSKGDWEWVIQSFATSKESDVIKIPFRYPESW